MRISDWSSDVCSSDLKEPKGFGGMAQIEGGLDEGQRVLLVEDLTTDGGSKAKFVHALRQAGATVDHTYVVFHYGIFPEIWETMDALGVKLHALARSEEHTSELQSLMRISYAVFCLKKK